MLTTCSERLWYRLTGPIFDKELRVCSRRKRYYLLRSMYLGLLAILIMVVWLAQTTSLRMQGVAYSVSRMAEIGRAVILSVAWFQFFMAQLAAVLFFCNAISDEVNRGTLNVLMTTPITALQVIAGKLLSKLLQLLLILALSLLTLSIVYCLGGMHWEFIIASFCITVTSVVFTGALTLFCSGRVKRPHTVVLMMVVFLGIYYSLGPLLLEMMSGSSGQGVRWLTAHPVAAMLEITISGAGNGISWPVHCGIMLGASLAVVAVTVIGLRRSMLTFAFERNVEKRGFWAWLKRFVMGRPARYPMELKHLSVTRLWHSGRAIFVFVLLLAGYAVGYYAFYVDQAGLGGVLFGTYSTTVGLFVGARTIVSASTAITKEKEGKSLSALLCCPIDSRQIIRGKAKQVYRANFIGWSVLIINSAVYRLIYTLIIPNISFGPGGIVATSIASIIGVIANFIFIVGFGFYISVRVKSSTAALVGGLVGYLIWFYLRYLFFLIPFWIFSSYGFYSLSTYVLPLVDIAAGLFFMRLAHRSLRKYAFC